MEDKSINAGKVGLTMGGDWKSSESYEKLTCVSHNGRSWAAKKNVSAGVEPSEANSAFWQLMSDRGVQGIQGPVGPQGNSAFDGTGVEIVNNLTQGGQSAVLSAEQGKVLKTELTELESSSKDVPWIFYNGNLRNDGVIVESSNRIYASNISFMGAIVVANGWLISSVAYYNSSNGAFVEYNIINKQVLSLGKENCVATIVIRREDNADIDGASYQTALPIENYVQVLEKRIIEQDKSAKDALIRLNNVESQFVFSTNKCSNIIEYAGCVIRGATGAIEKEAGYNTSEMFAIAPSTQYATKDVTFYAFYDANKNYISRLAALASVTFITPANAYYARVSSDTSPLLWQLNEGDSLLEYQKPNNAIKSQEDTTYNNAEIELEFGCLDYFGDIIYHGEKDVEKFYKFLRTQRYIKLDGLRDFSLNVPQEYVAHYFFYDANGKLIARSEKAYEKPASAKYLKCVVFKPSLRTTSTNKCSTLIEYAGCVVRGATGAIEAQDGYNTSEMFAISPSMTYASSGVTFYAFYDQNKNYISRLDALAGTTFVSPSNAYYARCSSDTEPFAWQLNEGTQLLEYEEPMSALVASGEIRSIPRITITYNGVLEYCHEELERLVFHKIIYGLNHSVNRCESLREDVLQDTGERDVDFANIMLPPNYSKDGKPVRLAYFCHGSNGIGWGNILCGGYYDLCKYVAKEGYAIMEIYGISHKYKDEATDNLGMPIAMTSFVESYKWAKAHLNIKDDGVVVWGKSAGGGPIGNLLYQHQIPVLAVAGLAPISDIYNELFRNRDAKAKAFYASQLGFEGAFSWSDRPLSQEQQENEFQYLLRNCNKGIGNNPVWSGVVGLDTHELLSESFKHPYNNAGAEYPTERALYESLPKYIPTPYKVWIAKDDANVDPRFYDYWKAMARKSGSYFELRYLPANTGKHNAVDTASNAIKADVVPMYSNETLSIPIAYIEMIAWWRRFGGNS